MWYNEHFAHCCLRIFNENTLDINTIWPWSSGIAAGMAHNQLRLEQHTPILQVSYIARYVFSIHCYINFAETNIRCYIHFYITNHKLGTEHIIYEYTIAIYIDNTYMTCYLQCYMTNDIKVHSWLCITTKGYVAVKDTYTICYITH